MLGLSLHDLKKLSGLRPETLCKMESGQQRIQQKHSEVLTPILWKACLKRVAELEKRAGELA